MRVSYQDPKPTDANDLAIVEGLKERRGDLGLLNVDLTLLRAPPIAAGWYVENLSQAHETAFISVVYAHSYLRSSFLKAVRTQNSLPQSIRETAISRVAALHQAWFEYEAHVVLLKQSSLDGLADLLTYIRAPPRETQPPQSIDGRHLAVLGYTDAMTLDIKVHDEVFQKLNEVGFTEREVVEITATVAAYNCVCRFITALDISEDRLMEKLNIKRKL